MAVKVWPMLQQLQILYSVFWRLGLGRYTEVHKSKASMVLPLCSKLVWPIGDWVHVLRLPSYCR